MTDRENRTTQNRSRIRRAVSASALVLCFAGIAAAAPSQTARCTQARLNLVSKMLKGVMACESKLALKIDHGSIDASGLPTPGAMTPNDVGRLLTTRRSCLERTAAKFETLWERNDSKFGCSIESEELAGEVLGLVEGLMDDLTTGNDYGTRLPLDFPDFNSVVFFAPFCDLHPDDFPTTTAYYDAVKENRCYPDLFREHRDVGGNRRHNLYRRAEHSGLRELSWEMVGWPCAEIAERAGLGTFDKDDFDIWLSTAYFSPRQRFVRSSSPYVLPSGTLIANDWADLTDGDLLHSIDELATGEAAENRLVVTGTGPSGSNRDPVNGARDLWTMDNWTLFQAPNDAPDLMHPGNTSKTGNAWTYSEQGMAIWWGTASNSPSSGYNRGVDGVYCFQQRGISLVTPNG